MAIDWTQEQLIPNDFTGGYQSFTPSVSGSVIASVGPGGDGQSQVGLAFVGDSVVNLWATGGSYVYSEGSSTSWLPGNATLPVAANDTFMLGAFVYTSGSAPTFNFWWVPASAGSTLLSERERVALREKMIAQAERTRPSLPAALVGAAGGS